MDLGSTKIGYFFLKGNGVDMLHPYSIIYQWLKRLGVEIVALSKVRRLGFGLAEA